LRFASDIPLQEKERIAMQLPLTSHLLLASQSHTRLTRRLLLLCIAAFSQELVLWAPIEPACLVWRRESPMLSLPTFLLIGGVAGWLAGTVARSSSPGCLGDIRVGMVGALVGNFVLSLLLPGEYALFDLSLSSLLMTLLGAIVLLLVLACGWPERTRAKAVASRSRLFRCSYI
jgi:uncharacterized membrane protein YeaQ/YmgE (transglycosylase-associated protein family)